MLNGFLKACRPPKVSNEMKCINEKMTWNTQDTNLSSYVPNANVNHTISGQGTGICTLDHSTTTPRAHPWKFPNVRTTSYVHNSSNTWSVSYIDQVILKQWLFVCILLSHTPSDWGSSGSVSTVTIQVSINHDHPGQYQAWPSSIGHTSICVNIGSSIINIDQQDPQRQLQQLFWRWVRSNAIDDGIGRYRSGGGSILNLFWYMVGVYDWGWFR